MILRYKDGSCIAAGKATKNGSELTYIGTKGTPKFAVGITVKRTKGDDGKWKAEFMNCALWGDQAEDQPAIAGGDMVFAVGTLERRTWQGRDGEDHISEEIRCDFITSGGKNMIPGEIPPAAYGAAAAGAPADNVAGAFAEIGDDDGELPF